MPTRTPYVTSRVAVVVLLALIVAACGGAGGDRAGGSADRGGDGTPTRVDFDPANFVDPTTSTNEYHPLRPGMQWVRGGTTEIGGRAVPHEVTSTMTDVVRMIDGVPAVAMLDQSIDAGEITQAGMDYFALDKDGNVWLMGGYSEDYEGGRYTNFEDAWLGRSSGAKPGILLPGEVTTDTPMWFVGAEEPEDDGTVAEPAKVGIDRCVEFGCYENVLVVREGEFGAINNELKYYAPGVGVIDNVPQDESLHQDFFELLNFVELSRDGLAEFSQIVLDLEAHARKTAPDVFGSVPPAERTS